MFNTVLSCHIALNSYLQQVNTNRKQVIKPEEYDMFLNTEILRYIEDKINPKSNPKQEGFEDNQRRVDELRELKKSLTLYFYDDIANRKYCIFPTDYYKLIVGGCLVETHYNKHVLQLTSVTEIKYKYTLEFPDDTPSTYGIQVYKTMTIASTSGIIFNKTYTKPCYAKDSKFEIVNYYLDYFRKDLGFNAYWEYYNGTYIANTFIITTNTKLTSGLTLSYTDSETPPVPVSKTSVEIIESLLYNTSSGNKITSSLELISSKNEVETTRNYYMSRNRQDQLLCRIDTDKLRVYYDSTFVPLTINLNYIIKPRLINYYYNTMPEITINEEIIVRTVDKIKSLIKDEQAYNMYLNNANKIQ
jgi:hypothetical protein